VSCEFISQTHGTGTVDGVFTWGSVSEQPQVDYWNNNSCSTAPTYSCQAISNWCVSVSRFAYGMAHAATVMLSWLGCVVDRDV
jgi:hypothetical protein